MSVEQLPNELHLNQFEKAIQPAVPVFYSLSELNEAVERQVSEPDERELVQTMCIDLARQNKEYLRLVLSMEAGLTADDLDKSRRRTHNGIINTFKPLVRYLGGEYQERFLKTFADGKDMEKTDRNKIGLWALANALQQLYGEINERKKQLAEPD